MRPYIVVSKIPNFDPTRLPFWDIYVREEKADTIQAGGTLGGKFTAGFSGGQRKLLLFELIAQRTAHQEDLLICLDEPFAGVTDDFVPFIVERLNSMRQKHNILLVTNDHVETLTKLSDNTITVSAIDRTTVEINQHACVNRMKAIYALSVGDNYAYSSTEGDVRFFYEIEVKHNGNLKGVAYFATFTYFLYLITFWNSNRESTTLILVAGGTITFFSVNPYLISLAGWRDAMLEESEALLHSSKGINKVLKCFLTFFIIFCMSLLEYGVVNVVVGGLESPRYWFAMLFDVGSLIFPHICLGIFTRLSFQTVQLLAGQPFLLMIFLSTTFSPGAGLPVLKELRYLWARYYFWCMVDAISPYMEGCPGQPLNEIALLLSSLLGVFIFLIVKLKQSMKRGKQERKKENMRASMMDEEFHQLQVELYGERMLRRLKNQPSLSMHNKPPEERPAVLTLPNGNGYHHPPLHSYNHDRDAIIDEEEAEVMTDTLVDGHTIPPPPSSFTIHRRTRSTDSVDSHLSSASLQSRTLLVGLMEV
jgi:hypothetical protein